MENGLRFHHVSVLAGNPEAMRQCVAFYVGFLGMHIVKREGLARAESSLFLADGACSRRMPLEIIGEQRAAREGEFLRKHEPGIHHLAYAVHNTELVADQLEAAEVCFRISLHDQGGGKAVWCMDPAGDDIEIVETDESVSQSLETENPSLGARFNHVGILTGSRTLAQLTEDFYANRFNMQAIHRGNPADPARDWVYLEDFTGENPYWLEIVGPALWEDEERFLAEHGPGMDHICFTVSDVDADHRRLTETGAQVTSGLLDYYGSRMFYLRDPVGVLIQVAQQRPDRL
jgi:catechol 2,3-dioxygenase-like lactoylglutathione lyase family enzyme